MLALVTVATLEAYPLEPIQLTLISTLTIGVPGFFLALGPNRRRYVPGFLRQVLRFAVPAGVVTGAAAYAGHATARWYQPDAGVAGARTTATLVVLVVALWTLVVLARPLAGGKVGLIASTAAVALLAVLVPAVAEGVFPLDVSPWTLAVAAGIGVPGALLVELVSRARR